MGRITVLCGLLWWCAVVCAADPAARLRLTEPVQLRYQETRSLALLSHPWQGSGYLLADPEGTLVKLQLSPERVIMIATPKELLYYASDSGERHRVSLPVPVPQLEGIILMQQLLRGELDPIRRRYRLDYREDKQGWALELTPRNPETAPFSKVSLRGDLQGQRQVLEITEQDGDHTVTEMTLDDRGARLTYTIARLVREAAGE